MLEQEQLALEEALAESLPQLAPVEPPAGVKSALRARILQRSKGEPLAAHSLTIHAHEGRWFPICPGVEFKLLHQNEAAKSFLLKLAPGAEVPEHEHPAADEECLVVQGEASIGDLRLSAGAYHLARKGTRHAGNLRSATGAIVLIHTGVGNPPQLPRAAATR